MRYIHITPEYLNKLEQEKVLHQAYRDAYDAWNIAANEARNDMEYAATRPLFDEYLIAYEEWRKFNDNLLEMWKGDV